MNRLRSNNAKKYCINREVWYAKFQVNKGILSQKLVHSKNIQILYILQPLVSFLHKLYESAFKLHSCTSGGAGGH